MADINKVYDEAVRNGLLDASVSKDEFKNIMSNAQERKAYFDYVQEHKRGFYGDDFNKFSAAAERMVSGAVSAPRMSVAHAMPAMPAEGGNPRVADNPAPTNAAEYEANRINQDFGGENNLQLGGQGNSQRAMEQYSAEGLETRREQILSAAERKKQQRIREQEQWEREHPFLAALSGVSRSGAMPAPSTREKLEETPTKMFAGTEQEQLREIEDELGRRAGDLYIPQAKETIKQSEDFVAQVRANDKTMSAGQKVNLNRAEYLLTKANEIANAGSRFDDSKAMANWWEGLKNDLDRDVIAGVGLVRDVEINGIVEKVNNGEELTDDESALLNAYFTLATARDARQFDLSTGYQIGQGTAQSVPFMIDMFVSRGAGAWGKHMLIKALKAAKFKDIARVERYLQMAETAEKGGKMTARDIARKASYEGIATPLQTVLMPSAWRQMQQEATQMRLERGENDLSLLDRTRLFTNATKETLTERVGGDMIDWGLGRVFGKMTQPWRLGGKGKYAVNEYIQSPIGETGEEYIGALIDLARSYNPLYDDESNETLREGAKEMFSWEGLGKTFGTVLPMSLPGGAANMAELRYKTGRMEQAREDIILRMQQAMDMSEEDARQIMAYTESAGTGEEFADRLDIVGSRLTNAYEDMGADVKTKDKKGNVSGVVGGLREELNEYATQAAGVNKIVEQFSAEYDKLSDEEKQNAKALLEQARKENRDRNIRIAAKSISKVEADAMKNRSNNYLYNVSFADGSLQEVDAAYVVGGNVTVTHDEEGKVLFDKEASEDEVVEVRIVHADGTSEVKQVSVGELDLLQEPITADEYIEERASVLYGEMVSAAEAAEQQSDITPPPAPSPQAGRGSLPAQPQQEVVSVVGYTTDNNGGRVAQLSAPININGTITTIVPESMLDEIMTGEGYTKTEDGAWAREVKRQPKPVEQEQEQPKAEQEPKAEPIGHDERWGNVYQWVLGKAKEAVDFLRKNKSGYLKGVFRRDEIGDIDLMWGNDKAGLQHIIQRHIVEQDDFNSVDEAVEAIGSTIKNGNYRNHDNSIVFEYKNNRVVVAPENNGRYVVTAYDYVRSIDEKKKNNDLSATLVTAGQTSNEGGTRAVIPESRYSENTGPASERNEIATEKLFGQQTLQESGAPLYAPNLNSEGKGSENNPNTQANAQKNVPFSENLAAAPRDEQGRVDYAKIEDADELARVVTAQMKGGKDVAKRYMEAKKKLASDTLKKTKHKKEDLDDPDAFLAVEQRISELKREENRWNAAITALNSIRTSEEQAAYEAEQARRQAEREARKQTRTGVVPGQFTVRDKVGTSPVDGSNTMAARYAAAQKIDGNTGTITAANGQVLKGHYVLVSADGLTPSHDARNGFDMSAGYPTVDGKSINDRDYKNDPEEQAKVQQIAQQYNGNAIKNMPIVSDEGLVYNGNGRTMAGQLAAQQGTDGAYRQALTDNAAQFGFTAEQVASVPNARVVFQTDERLPYNTTTLALFNATEQQTQSNTAKAAANTRKLTPEAVGHIIDAISGFDNTDAFFSHNKAPFELINTLIEDGILTDRDKASLIDGDRLSGAGKDMLMGVLFGTAFDENTIRLLADNAQVQNSVMRALPQILENKGLGEYSLFDHINNAIAAIYDMRKNGMSFFEFTRQTDIFGKTTSDRYTAFELLLAEEMMNGGVAAFRDVMTLYNERASQLAGGQADIFGELTPREDIENAIVEYYKNKRNGQEEQPGQSSTPKQPSDRQGGGETEPAVAGAQGGDGQTVTDMAAGEIINQIEEEAEEFEEIELTPENWFAQFGEDGIVETPIGMVKMGENQYSKLNQKGRDGKLGMIKPTLERPSIIIEYNSNAKEGQETERASSYIFVKAFVGKNGERMYFFTSITIRKDGKEVVISNQEKTPKRISKLIKQGKLTWINTNSTPHPTPRVEGSVPLNGWRKPTNADNQPTVLGINPSGTKDDSSSADKGSEKSANDQTNSQKNAEKVENASENGEKAGGNEQKEVFGSVDELDSAVSNILATYPAQSVHALVLRLLSQNGRLADDWMWEHQITTQSDLGEWCKLAEGYEKARLAYSNSWLEYTKWREEYIEKHYPTYAKDGIKTEAGKAEYEKLKEDKEYQKAKADFNEESEKLSLLADNAYSPLYDYEKALRDKIANEYYESIRKNYQQKARAIFGLNEDEDVTDDILQKATPKQLKEYWKLTDAYYDKERYSISRETYYKLKQSERKNEGTAKKKSERGVRKHRVSGVSRAAKKTQVSAIVEQLQKAMPGTRVHTVQTTEQAMEYIAKRQQKAREQEVEDCNAAFNEQLSTLNEDNADSVVMDLGTPSDILLAAGVPNKPIKLYGNKIIKKAKLHGYAISELRDLPNAIARPLAVFNNYNRDGNRSILTELRTKEGNFLVAINVGKGGVDVDFDIVTSIFGKDKNSIVNWLNNGYATYIDKQRTLDYLHLSAPIAEASNNQELNSAAKVVKSFDNPKLLDEKDKIAGVFAHFQRVFHGSGADFDVFDSSHIGEGDGNQSYGYGMYVTEVKEVARSYAGTNGRRGIIYKVTIPDNTGRNYLQCNEFLDNQENTKIANALYKHLISTDEEGLYDSKQAKQSLREELEYIFSGNVPGDYAYASVSSYLGSDAAASKFLHSLGYVGIVYPTNSMAGGNTEGQNNYVIFDDGDLRIDGKERFELDEQGEVAGATMDDGTVLLVEDHMRIDTPFHEFAHKLYAYAKASDSHLLDAINKYISQAPQSVKDYVAAHYPDTIGTDAYLDEVFAWALSNQSEESLRSFLRERGLGEQSTAADMAKAQSWYNRLWKAIQELWGKVKSAFAKDNGKQYADLSVFDAYQTMSVEEIGNRLYDTLMGGNELPGTSNSAEAQYDELDYDSDNLTDAQQLATDAVMQALDNAGIETEVVSEEEANAEVEKEQSDSSVRLMLQIMKQGTKGQSNYPIAGTKLQKNLQTTKEKYKNIGITTENAITDISKSLGAKNTGKSNYITIEAKNGKVFTLRISNHNATVSNFDNNGERNGISIVISRHDNDGITNNGNAHVVEFFYSDKALNKAVGTPIADIIGALEQTLYSGEYTDPIGLAQVQEVNIPAELLKNHNGKVYGYAKGGKIYLTENGINPNTPIHEYAHLWAKAMRRNNPQGWQSVVERLKGTPMWDEVVNDPNYQSLTDENAIAGEVLARYSGKRGAERMEKAAQQLIDQADTRGEVANAISLIQRVKKALQDFWKWVGTNLFDIKEFRSAEEIADRVLYDLMNGTDIRPREQRNSRAEFLVRQYANQYAEPSDFTEDGQVRPEVLEEIRREREEIERKAKADGTWMKAPNGEPTKLTQEQWVTVRTKRFKNWFGDWELATKNIEIIEAAAEHGFKSFDEARAWAKANIARILSNEETGGKGEIRISNNAIDKFLSESAVSKSESKDVHLSVLKVLPDVIHNSIDAEQHPDYLKGEDGKRSEENGVNTNVMIHRLYGAVEIDGKLYRVKVTLKEDIRNKALTKKAYSYEATKIELLAGTFGKSNDDATNTSNSTIELLAGTLADTKRTDPSTSNSISGAKLLKNVETSKQNGKKLLDFSQVVDENGEPMVVYHGSNHTFTVFSPKKISAKGSFFSSNKSVASSYAPTKDDVIFDKNKRPYVDVEFLDGHIERQYYDLGGTYSVFLNIRNPFIIDCNGANWDNIEYNGHRVSTDFIETYSISKGYDGVIFKNILDGSYKWLPKSNVFVSYNPNQIKSATDNVGTFSSENDDIRFSIVSTGKTQNEDGSIRPDETLGEYAHRVARAHEQKKLEDAFKRAHLASSMTINDTKASKQKADAIANYLSFTFGDEYPLQVVPTTDNLAEQLQSFGIEKERAEKIETFLANRDRARGTMIDGTIFVLANRIGSISEAKDVYIHERQHVDNAEYDLTEPLIEHISAEDAVDMLRMLKPIAYKAYADMYLGKGIAGHRMLLDELIAYAVSESMQFAPNNPVQYLQKKGITNQQLLNIVENECRRHRFGQSDPGATSHDGRVRTQGERGRGASSNMRTSHIAGRYEDNRNQPPLNISEAPTPAPSETRGDYAARFKMWYDQQRTFDAERAYTKAQKDARTKTENALQHVADRYRPLQKFQEYILAQGGSIRPSEQDADGNLLRPSADAYQDTTLATGRAGYQIQRFASHQLQDMVDAIADILNSHALDGIDIRWNNIDTLFADRKDRKNGKPLTTRELIGIYAQAKDCQEAIEQGLPDRGAAGFEKNLQDQDSNPVSHQEVIRMVESAVPAEKIKTLWDAIHAATQFSLDYQLAKGMIDQETHDRYTRRYYVPERGWRERDLDGRTDAYVEGRDVQLKSNPYNPALKKAHGRESIASDPFAYIQSIAETTILSAERNSVKQKFLQLLLDNQEIGMQSGAWQIRRAYVARTTDPAGVEQQVVTYEKPTREEDIITTIVPESMIEQRTRDERLQHRVTVMRDGQQYIIEMQDEALANALNSNFQEAKWLSNSVANVARTGVRYMSAINTQYNPAFAIWNLYRDLQIGLINNLAKEDKAFTARFIKNIAAVQPVIMRYVASDRFKGKEDFGSDKSLSKYLQEYFESGAQTGFSYMRDINTLGKEFDKLLQAQSLSKKAGKAALGALSIATELSELTVRFAEFATARQMGFTTEEAAAKAKEISVNFDRKGLLGGTFSGLYSFFNATIQGGWNILRGMTNKRARRAYLATAALYMAAGVLNTLLNPDDPDDEVFFSEYDRQTNFLFGKIKLPVTHFFRMFFAAGVNITLFAQNKKTGKKTAQDIVKFTLDEVVPASIVQVHNAWGYNPSTNEYEWDWTQYIQQSAPSIIIPIVDVALNRDFKGATVHREPFLSSEKENEKNVAMEKRNTPSIYHDIAYGLHRLSGGNPDIKTRGYRTDGWIDINPNDLQHLVEGYFGGSGGFFGDLYSTAANAFRGEFDPSTVPVLNRAFRPYQQERSYTQQYWMLKNRVDAYDKWLEDIKKNDRQTYQAEKQSELYRTYLNANQALEGMKKPSDEQPYSKKETKEKTQQLMQLNVEWNKAQ